MALLLICAAVGFFQFAENKNTGDRKENSWLNRAGSFFSRQMERHFFQVPRYLEEGEGVKETFFQADRLLLWQFPLYGYALTHSQEDPGSEDGLMAELIGRQEGTDEDVKNIDEDSLDYGEDALHIENSVLEEMERENGVHNQTEEEAPEQIAEETPPPQEVPETEGSGGFQAAAYPAYSYDWSQGWDYQAFISNFYAVDKSTNLKEEYVGLGQLLYQDLSVNKESEGPQILIYHTHSREDFVDSVPGDPSTTILGAGEKLARLLQDQYGFRVLHHTGEYDSERDDAYNKSLPALMEILEQNPSIEVVIDLHRDAVAGDRKLVMDLQGRPTARFMFFNGLSYGRKSGDIDYLENPYIQENLAFSFQAQVAANEYYPGIARKVYLKAYRYNMHLRPRSMLIELGAQNNTVEEILNACDPLAHILAIVLG